MRFIASMLAVCAIFAAQPRAASAADVYPVRPVKIICVYPAGGGLDIVVRSMAQKLSEAWGRPVIIENVAGGGTTFGAAAAARATPDGYTLLATDISYAIAPAQYDKLSYNPEKDLVPISLFAIASHALVVTASFPVNSFDELIAYAKANPGKTLFATPGPGSIDHLAWALLNKRVGGGIIAVPYKGSAASLLDVVAGRVQVYSGATGTLVNYAKNAQLRPLAVFETERASVLPDVPTIAEVGMPDIEMNAWYGLMAPAGTPQEIIDEITKQVAKSLESQEVRGTLARLGNVPVLGKGPKEFQNILRADFKKWAEAVAIAGGK